MSLNRRSCSLYCSQDETGDVLMTKRSSGVLKTGSRCVRKLVVVVGVVEMICCDGNEVTVLRDVFIRDTM